MDARGHIEEAVGLEPRVLDWAAVALPPSMPGAERLRSWLAEGLHADMQWMVNSLEARLDPRSWKPGLTHAVVFLWKTPGNLHKVQDQVRVAAYAQGVDYHITLEGWIRRLLETLRASVPNFEGACFADRHPVMERELAMLAGLGWIGKNSMLIHPRLGSSFLLGGFLTSFPLENAGTVPVGTGHCGACRRCLDLCPSGAILEDAKVDARRCASYLTIEKRGPFSPEESGWVGNWIFGCDACQTACPWNAKHLKESELVWPSDLATWSELLTEGNGLRSRLRNSPLQRTGRKGLLRNLQACTENLETQKPQT